jgi:hypothetical protein
MGRLAMFGLVVGLSLAVAAPVLAVTPVSVPARDGWVSSGITVSDGQQVAVMTLGSTHTAKIPDFHEPGIFKSASGPAGQVDGSTCGDAYATFSDELKDATGPCALDAAYFGELIGRIGDVVFRIGATESFVAPASGPLELAMNDLANTYGDNTGSYTVTFR